MEKGTEGEGVRERGRKRASKRQTGKENNDHFLMDTG